MKRPLCGLASLVLIAGTFACSSLSRDLARAGELYQDAYYEAAESWLLEVEPRVGELSASDRARFYYLRGMSAYRLGQRQDARHFLVLCREVLLTREVAFERQAMAALERALEDLLQPIRANHPKSPLNRRFA